MNVSSRLLHVASLAAVLGAVALLLGDSDEDRCATFDFDRTFDLVTDCAGGRTARVRIVYSDRPPASGGARSGPARVELVSGAAFVKEARLEGRCGGEGQAYTLDRVVLTLDGEGDAGAVEGALDASIVDAAASAEPLTCTFLLDALGQQGSCRRGDATVCTLRATAAP